MMGDYGHYHLSSPFYHHLSCFNTKLEKVLTMGNQFIRRSIKYIFIPLLDNE